MAIDFTLPADVLAVRERVRAFMENEVAAAEARMRQEGGWRKGYAALREKAHAAGLWAPHMPAEWGGMGLGALAMAFVSAECGRTLMGAYVLNCHAPDEGNMHTLLHHADAEQKERYLRPLVDGRVRSCFAMTEPEVAGSDPTGIRSTAVRDVETMAGHGNHCEIRLEDVRVADAAILGGRGQGHRLGQARLGPARLAHCMRWIGSAEKALEMLVRRALERELHGGVLADKQLIQAMMAESAMELYAAKRMVLHAAYLIEHGQPFRQEVSIAKHHVANMLWRITDRAVQVHGALGYSTDTPLESMLRHARSARLVDGADEVHLSQIAAHLIAAFREDGSTRRATGAGLL